MAFWWVNQNQTYNAEIGGGFLWSPKRNANGARNQFYENMLLVRPGDVVFSFCDTRIRAIGKVLGAAEESEKPAFGAAGEAWSQDGWLVPVEFVELSRQVRPKDFIADLLPYLADKYAPIRSTGDGLQNVYLASISPEFAGVLLDKIGEEARQIVEDTEALGDNQAEEDLKLRTDVGPTTKRQLVLARRGQGLFKANVLLIEKRCRVTGVDDPRLLIASHIKPWSKSSDTEKLDGHNGLLLSPHVDALFDKGFISFQNDGRLLCSPRLDQSIMRKWSLDGVQGVGTFHSNQLEYLSYHREMVFKS